MAVGNQPTLMDINWQEVMDRKKLQNEQDFQSDYLSSLKDNANEIAPKIYVDSNGALQFTKGASGKMSPTELWNNYSNSAKSRGINPDLNYFETQLKPYYSQIVNEQFNTQMGSLALQGVPVENVHDLYRTNEDFRLNLISAIQNSTSPEEVGILKNYIAPDEGKGLLETLSNADPFVLGAAGYGGYKFYKWGRGKVAAAKDDSWLSKAKGKKMGVWGPLGAYTAAQMIPGMIGMDPKSQEQIGNLAPYGIGGYYGLKALDSFTGGANRREILNTKSRSELAKRAKDLGIPMKDLKDGSKYKSLKGMKKVVGKKIPRVKGPWQAQALAALASIAAPALFGGEEREAETLTPGRYVSPF